MKLYDLTDYISSINSQRMNSQIWNGQRDQEKVTKEGKFGPNVLPISGRSPHRDIGCLLTLEGLYKPPTRLPFWGLFSVIVRLITSFILISLCLFHSIFTQTSKKSQFLGSVQFSHSVVSDSLRPHEPLHARPPCPSPTPGVHPNPHPLSWWCHPTISSSVFPFSSCPKSLPASGSFPISQPFSSGGQSIGASASASVLPMNIQG